MKTLLDLADNECRYALNDGGPFLFCAEPQAEKSSYCPLHKDRCFQLVREDLRDKESPAYAAAIRRNLRPNVMILMDKAEA